MANIGKVYIEKFQRKLDEFNKPRPLAPYLVPLIGDKKDVVIAEIGAGPMNTIGEMLDGVNIKIVASDILAEEYKELWKKHNAHPFGFEVEYQDMENLTYPDESFDIVHCRNAIDHTQDLHKAIKEMQRVCKKGGYVYLAHAPSQKKKYGGHHYWNIEEVDLPEFLLSQDSELIIHIWKKI